METRETILWELKRMGIEYELAYHPPAHTMKECEEPMRILDGLVPKNLFLRPRRQEEFYLCVLRPDSAFRASAVSRQVGSSRLQFASEEEISRLLHTRPGAITPLALIFEEAKEVRLLVDERLKREKRLIFHPCENTCSLAISGEDFFEKFLLKTGHHVTWVRPSAEA